MTGAGARARCVSPTLAGHQERGGDTQVKLAVEETFRHTFDDPASFDRPAQSSQQFQCQFHFAQGSAT